MAFDFNGRNESSGQMEQNHAGGFSNRPRERGFEDSRDNLPDRYNPDERRHRRRRGRGAGSGFSIFDLPWKRIIGLILVVVVIGVVWTNRAIITSLIIRIIVYVVGLVVLIYLLKKMIFP